MTQESSLPVSDELITLIARLAAKRWLAAQKAAAVSQSNPPISKANPCDNSTTPETLDASSASTHRKPKAKNAAKRAERRTPQAPPNP